MIFLILMIILSLGSQLQAQVNRMLTISPTSYEASVGNQSLVFRNPARNSFDLDIYDINGKKIQSLLKNVELQMGEHQIRWNANKFGSGLYFVQLKNNKNILTQKIMLLK